MAKKIKKYADGGETISDVLSGNFPAARRFKEGYDQMPDTLKDPMLGLSVGKAPKSLTKNIVDKINKSPRDLSMGERKLVRDNALARAETTMEDGVKVTKLPYMGEVGEIVAKRPRRIEPTDKQLSDYYRKTQDESRAMAREAKLRDQLDQPRQLTGELNFKKGGTVKSSSASKRADGCAQRGKTKGKICQENSMAKKDEYLEGYELGIKKGKADEPGTRLPDRYNKNILAKVLSGSAQFFPEHPEVKNLRLKREADDKYLDSPMGKGEAQGRAEYDKASELESIRAKKNPPKVIPMTKEDAEVINSKQFKKANEATIDKKKGGKVKCMVRGGGIEVRGKTRGKIC